MTITQEPTASGTYFQNNIPDILIQKTDANESVTFEFRRGSELILSEKYVYDVDGLIRIRNLGDIVSKYLVSNPVMPMNITSVHTPGLANCLFLYAITEGTVKLENSFIALKCEADMIVDAAPWTKVNFLTRAYREKITAKGRNEYLSFYKLDTYDELVIRYKLVYLKAGVMTEFSTGLDVLPISTARQIVTFNTSIGRILTSAGLPLDTIVLQYDIWIAGIGLETNHYTYLVDNTLYRDHTSFVYINSFGVMETFTATGKMINKKTNEYNLGNIDNHYRKITQDFVSEKTMNSGYLSDVEMEWIDDLITSYTVGLYTPTDGMSEEITLVGVDKTDITSNELQAFSFGYRRAKNNNLVFANAAKGIFDRTFDKTFN